MRFKKYLILCALTALASFAIPAFAQTANSARTGNFVQEASIGNLFEILSSQLAVKKAITPEIKGFAQMMVVDHTGITDTLQATLDASHSNLVPADKLNMKRQEMLNQLTSAFAPKFDGLYIQAQIDSHAESIALFQDYAKNGDDPQLRKFATDTIPILELHQLKARSLSPAKTIAGQ